MSDLVQRYLDQILQEQAGVTEGALASYIPELPPSTRRVRPDVSSSDGYIYESGDTATNSRFSRSPSRSPMRWRSTGSGRTRWTPESGWNPPVRRSTRSASTRRGTPKNPMINAGAIAAVSLVPGRTPDERFALIREFYSAFAGRPLDIDEDVYASEKEHRHRNRAIAYMLQSFGVLDGDPEEVLDVYFRQCSCKVTTTDLARMAATLARGGMNPLTGRRVTEQRWCSARSV